MNGSTREEREDATLCGYYTNRDSAIAPDNQNLLRFPRIYKPTRIVSFFDGNPEYMFDSLNWYVLEE